MRQAILPGVARIPEARQWRATRGGAGQTSNVQPVAQNAAVTSRARSLAPTPRRQR